MWADQGGAKRLGQSARGTTHSAHRADRTYPRTRCRPCFTSGGCREPWPRWASSCTLVRSPPDHSATSTCGTSSAWVEDDTSPFRSAVLRLESETIARGSAHKACRCFHARLSPTGPPHGRGDISRKDRRKAPYGENPEFASRLRSRRTDLLVQQNGWQRPAARRFRAGAACFRGRDIDTREETVLVSILAKSRHEE